MSSGFSTFIVALTALNIAAAVWLLVWMRKKRGESQITTDTTGHVWDGDLREYNNPLPRWWLWLFVLTVIFALGYLALYPGLGNAKGSLGWSSKSQFDAMQADVPPEARFSPPFAERVEVADDAPAIDRLVAYNGRRPAPRRTP